MQFRVSFPLSPEVVLVPSVRIERVTPDGDVSDFRLSIMDDGLMIYARPTARHLNWDQLRQLADLGLPTPCRYGVVVDGALAEAHDTEAKAWDRVTEHRAHGCEVSLIRLPIEKV